MAVNSSRQRDQERVVEGNVSDVQREIQEALSGKTEVTVMVVGKSNHGKSTLLNNLFDLNLDAGILVHTEAIKEILVERNGVTFTFIDTPGLSTIGSHSKISLEKMKRRLNFDSSFTLLYCFNMSPGFEITNEDVTILRQITSTFGSEIWSRCILALTFSDTLRDELDPNETEVYKAHLRGHVAALEQILKTRKMSNNPIVLPFDIEEDVDRSDKIVAIPIAKTKERGRRSNIWPSNPCEPPINWIDKAYLEIVKKSGIYSGSLTRFRYPHLLGAVIGGILGAPLGPDGVLFGAMVGVKIAAHIKKKSNGSMIDIHHEVSDELSLLI